MSPGCDASTDVMASGCYWPIDSCLVGSSCGSCSSNGFLSQLENHSIAGIMWLTPADGNCAGRHTAREGAGTASAGDQMLLFAEDRLAAGKSDIVE